MSVEMIERDVCGVNPTDKVGLRIGAVFVVLVTSLVGTLFPVITKRVKRLRTTVPGIVFEFGKFFGSGVILSTALIHLLQPASYALGPQNTYAYGGCISDAWSSYPYAFALCLIALFFTFVGELFAFRIGTAYMARKGVSKRRIRELQAEDVVRLPPTDELDPTQEGRVEGPEVDMGNRAVVEMRERKEVGRESTIEDSRWKDASELSPASAQILGVAILEFGILFHSLIIGMTLTLSPPDDFMTLFIVIIFHQMFEGLGLGTRLAFLQLPPSWKWVPLFGAIAYSVITPLGMVIGLGARQNLSMTSGTASIVAGIMDALSAGILLYAATVELIAHEFIFSTRYQTCSWKRVYFVLFCFALGAGIMSVLGKWA